MPGSPSYGVRDLQSLADVEEIEKTKARYCRFVDTREYVQLRKLFTDDCGFSIAGGVQSSKSSCPSLGGGWENRRMCIA
ncbi:nuclear transport factor 2 family protein [Streptomyces sp. NPDC019507]|uniref:nuclear transport factor 2 family protein n=1 Tax=Streptomyces sp. NPDC019507 TaxID=3154689 RepID=UPI00340EA554